MLYLLIPADDLTGSQLSRRPLAAATARIFETALLQRPGTERRRLILEALNSDRDAAVWAMRHAEIGLGCTINRLDDAAGWLSERFEQVLGSSLAADEDPSAEIEGRLPALAARLNELTQAASHFQARLEHEKLESLKELAYGASHEINNPLANIAARAQSLLEEECDGERRRKLSAIYRQAMRAHEMISDLMLFARPPKLIVAECELQELAGGVVAELAELASEADVCLSFHKDDPPIVASVDATQAAVAIRAVIQNAIEASAPGGNVDVVVRVAEKEGDRYAEIKIRDDGPGISENVRAHLFDPFFSGREAGRGLGFGLSKCWRIVTGHGGLVTVDPGYLSGARFSILFPMAGSA